jgi:hypothetical protein
MSDQGYHIRADGISWRMPGSEGELSFAEIAEAGPQAILTFGMLAQLGQLDRGMKNATEAMVASAHASLEVSKALAKTIEGANPEAAIERAESMVNRMLENLRKGGALGPVVVTPPPAG